MEEDSEVEEILQGEWEKTGEKKAAEREQEDIELQKEYLQVKDQKELYELETCNAKISMSCLLGLNTVGRGWMTRSPQNIKIAL